VFFVSAWFYDYNVTIVGVVDGGLDIVKVGGAVSIDIKGICETTYRQKSCAYSRSK
jgi:hypothetical protein